MYWILLCMLYYKTFLLTAVRRHKNLIAMKKICLIVLAGALCYLAPACDNKRESISVAEVSISPAGPLALLPDKRVQLEATVVPDNATDKVITWSSSNPDVATVYEDGLLVTVDGGEAVITAAASEGISGVLNVAVAPKDDEWVFKASATERNTTTWGYPSNALDPVRWTEQTVALSIIERGDKCFLPMLTLMTTQREPSRIINAINSAFEHSAQTLEHNSTTFTPIGINLLKVPGCAEIFEDKSIAEVRIALGNDVLDIIRGWAFGFGATLAISDSWNIPTISTLAYETVANQIKFTAQFEFDNNNKCTAATVAFIGAQSTIETLFSSLTSVAAEVSTMPKPLTPNKDSGYIFNVNVGDIADNPFSGNSRQEILEMDLLVLFLKEYVSPKN